MKRHSSALVALLAGVLLACVTTECIDPNRRTPTFARDSAVYTRRLALWQRDSVVLDSISRTISTDSLYRLNHALLTTVNPAGAERRIMCEEIRLGWRYGEAAAEVAMNRMRDTLWTPNEQATVHGIEQRLPQPMVLEYRRGSCGDLGPRAPDMVDSTRLDVASRRPVPPPGW